MIATHAVVVFRLVRRYQYLNGYPTKEIEDRYQGAAVTAAVKWALERGNGRTVDPIAATPQEYQNAVKYLLDLVENLPSDTVAGRNAWYPDGWDNAPDAGLAHARAPRRKEAESK